MTMSEPLTLASALAAGVLLGAMFFGGLWWTVQKGVSSDKRAFWFVASMPLRMIMTLAGFYFVARGHAQRLLMCLLGFVMARLVATRLVRGAEAPNSSSQEAGHAPEPR
jgi:F1F0 ATPase subunit 2